jgi:hypothetical protein
MRYKQPRSAQDSEEKQKEREQNMQPFTFQNPIIEFEEGKKGSYRGNVPLNKDIHKKMKSYYKRGKA